MQFLCDATYSVFQNQSNTICSSSQSRNQYFFVKLDTKKQFLQKYSMGKKNNQKFVQIPTGRLKNRIEQLCNQYSIRFLETEESYTSKASSLDLDDIPVFGAKPEGWKASGKRVKRGLYRSATGIEFNADINGAIGIARKVAEQYGFQFDARGFARGVLTMPRRVRLWDIRTIPV